MNTLLVIINFIKSMVNLLLTWATGLLDLIRENPREIILTINIIIVMGLLYSTKYYHDKSASLETQIDLNLKTIEKLNTQIALNESTYKKNIQQIKDLAARDAKRLKQVEAIAASTPDCKKLSAQQKANPNKVTKDLNSNAKCIVDNFGKTDGKCVAGRWIKI